VVLSQPAGLAIKLHLSEAGLPAGAINLVVGSGGTVGEWLVTDPRVAKVTFTGSPPVGRRILQIAGIKKVTLELGNTSPVIIAPDADLDLVAKRCAVGAFYNSGSAAYPCSVSTIKASWAFAKFIRASGPCGWRPLDEAWMSADDRHW
jgi:acyl-CoA reductase-like NAD-dependent aldehyde dehydrogenase